MNCKLVACGVVASEVSGATDSRSSSSREEGRSKVLSGWFRSIGQISISGVNFTLNHLRGVIVSDTHLIDLRAGIGIKAQKRTRGR